MSRLSGRRPLIPLLLALLCSGGLLLMAACGGGGEGPQVDEFGIIDFGPDDPADDIQYQLALARENAEQGLTFEPERLVQVNVVYSNQVRLERLERVIRDMIRLLETNNAGEINLDWVIRVHQAVEDADFLFAEAIRYRLPEGQVEEFGDYYVEVLETIQLGGYGASRLLAAAVLVGPEGRSLLNFTDTERVRYDVLVKEARFYLNEAERNFKELSKELNSKEGALREN